MKKFYFLLMLVVALAFTSCESCEGTKDDATASITWNIDLNAKGEGKLVVSYPTGRLTLDGAASFDATSSNDSVLNAILESAPTYNAIMANPANYSDEQVYVANEFKSAFHVDTLAGTWELNAVGYAKYGNIYIVIDEHLPHADTAAVVMNDTVPVLE